DELQRIAAEELAFRVPEHAAECGVDLGQAPFGIENEETFTDLGNCVAVTCKALVFDVLAVPVLRHSRSDREVAPLENAVAPNCNASVEYSQKLARPRCTGTIVA